MRKFKEKYENNIGIKYSWNLLGIILGTCYTFIKNIQIIIK